MICQSLWTFNSHLQEDIDNIVQWSDDNHMKINGKKTKEMVSSFKKVPPFIPPLKINSLDIDRVTISKHLGIYVSSDLKWGPHVDKIHAKHSKSFIFWHAWSGQVLRKMNYLTTRSVLEYACPAWSTGIIQGKSDSLEQIQKCAIYIIAPHLQYEEAITKFTHS